MRLQNWRMRELIRTHAERARRASYLREVRRQVQIINESPSEDEILSWIEEASDFSEWTRLASCEVRSGL